MFFIAEYKLVEMELEKTILPFYEFKCPFCNFIFVVDAPVIDNCSAFFCHRCKQKIDKK